MRKDAKNHGDGFVGPDLSALIFVALKIWELGETLSVMRLSVEPLCIASGFPTLKRAFSSETHPQTFDTGHITAKRCAGCDRISH